MVQTVHRGVAQRAVDLRPAHSRQPRGISTNSFSLSRLAGIGSPAATPSTRTPATSQNSATGQNPASTVDLGSIINIRQAITPASAPSTAAAGSVATDAAAEPAPAALYGDDAVVQSLKDALTAAGIDYSNLGLTVHQDIERYPGGAYLNRYISVNTHDHQEGLMTDLVAMNPNIAVGDIKRMLGIG